jgi:hypothetical protein
MVCLNKKKKPKLADLGFFLFSKSSLDLHLIIITVNNYSKSMEKNKMLYFYNSLFYRLIYYNFIKVYKV